MPDSTRRFALLVMLTASFLATTATAGAQGRPELRHPYLFFSTKQLPALRKNFASDELAAYRKLLLDNAEQARRARVSTRHNHFPGRCGSLIWAYALTGEQKYAEAALRYVRAVWDAEKFPEWSEMTVGAVATVYDVLHGELDEADRKKIAAYLGRALEHHVKKMKNSWFYINPSNTVPVDAGGHGMGALALLGEHPLAAEGVKIARDRIKHYADRVFSADGGYIEGSLYWDFGGSYYAIFAHALHHTTGDDVLVNHPHYLKQQRFAEVILAGDGQQIPFNDTQPTFYGVPICADLGARLDQPLMLWLADRMTEIQVGRHRELGIHVGNREAFAAFAAYLRAAHPKPSPKSFPGVPTLSVLEKMNWGVMRSDNGFLPALMVGVKGSRGQLSHHKQRDLGSFVVYARGEMLLLDPGYFQGQADAHTLPLIDGKGPGVSGSTITGQWQGGPWRAMVIDSTDGYGKAARRVRRLLVTRGSEAVVVLDDLLPAADVPITAQYQAAHETRLAADGRAAKVQADKAEMGLWIDGPDLKLSVRKRDFGKSWRYAKLAERGEVAWHSLTGRYRAEEDNPLVTVLKIADRGDLTEPAVDRAEGKITVRVSARVRVTFLQADDGWVLRPPDEDVAGADRPGRPDRPDRPGRPGRPAEPPHAEKPAKTKPRPAKRPDRPTRSDEELAASRLGLARSYIKNGLRRKGREILQEIVEKYPDTPAATEARDMLARPGG